MTTYIVELNVKMTIKWHDATDEMEALQSAADFVRDIYNRPEDDNMLDEHMPMVLGATPVGGIASPVLF